MFTEKPQKGQAWDVVILGSGPSALTAAIYTTRGAASTLVIAGDNWGGQLMLTTEVDNFPGFSTGIQGPELMENMRQQAERFGAEIINRNAIELDTSNRPFKVKTQDEEYLGKTVIIATGAETRWLGIPGEEKLRGRGVSSCAPCDAPFFKDKKVIVVGGGDSAMEEALVLTKYASQVTIVHRRDSFRASAAMQKRVMENEKIDIMWNTEVVKLNGENKLESVTLKTESGEEEVQADGVFVAIGHIPSSSIFRNIINQDERGYIIPQPAGEFNFSTNVEGIFVAGDIHDNTYRQAITAAGYGAMAGMEALKCLDKEVPNW